MGKTLFLISAIFIALIFCPSNASAGEKATLSLSENSVAGGKTILAASDPGELPASSFYRVEFDCPVKPDSAKIDFSGGYPSSDVIFSSPGYYECEAELGVVTKSSCAGVQYSPLLKKSFKITVAPSGEK